MEDDWVRRRLGDCRVFMDIWCKVANFFLCFITCFISILDYPSRCQ